MAMARPQQCEQRKFNQGERDVLKRTRNDIGNFDDAAVRVGYDLGHACVSASVARRSNTTTSAGLR